MPTERHPEPHIAPESAAALPAYDEYLQQWPRFRGPTGAGVSPFTDIPAEWSVPDNTGIVWKTAGALAGPQFAGRVEAARLLVRRHRRGTSRVLFRRHQRRIAVATRPGADETGRRRIGGHGSHYLRGSYDGDRWSARVRHLRHRRCGGIDSGWPGSLAQEPGSPQEPLRPRQFAGDLQRPADHPARSGAGGRRAVPARWHSAARRAKWRGK